MRPRTRRTCSRATDLASQVVDGVQQLLGLQDLFEDPAGRGSSPAALLKEVREGWRQI